MSTNEGGKVVSGNNITQPLLFIFALSIYCHQMGWNIAVGSSESVKKVNKILFKVTFLGFRNN